jgi:hypothetical protein
MPRRLECKMVKAPFRFESKSRGAQLALIHAGYTVTQFILTAVKNPRGRRRYFKRWLWAYIQGENRILQPGELKK